MISFTTEQLNGWISPLLWSFVRILALIGVAPVFSESAIPALAKIGLAFALAVAVAPTMDAAPEIALGAYEALWLVGQQVLIGVTLGIAMRIVFAAVQAAGEFVGLQMGLSFAAFFDPSTGANTAVLSRLFNIVATLVFLALDGHLLMLAGLVHSFETLPVAAGALDRNGWGLVVEWGHAVFTSGLLMALPLICALLTMNLAMGILNRAAPQLTVFAVGFPLSLLAGLLLLAVVLPHAGPFFENLFQQGLEAMSDAANGLAGR